MTYIPTITDKEIAQVKFALRNHQGAGSRISVEELTESVYGKYSDNNRRKLRAVIHEINADADDKMLILTDTASGGFWTAGVDPSPAISHYYEEESRAMNTLKKVKAMGRKIEQLYGREALHPQPGQERML